MSNRKTIMVDAIHSLFCNKHHSSKMEDLINRSRQSDQCYYYMEQNLTECWEMADHVYWSEQAENIKNDLRASNPDEALRSIYKVLDMIEKTNELNDSEFRFFLRLLPVSSSDEVP